jgi:arsenate reductase (thioredoxin)
LTHLGQGRFEAHSAGLEPGNLNPFVVRAMMEDGIDISNHQTKSVDRYLNSEPFDYVITVCDETSAERCPVFPGNAKRLHWGFPDPSAIQDDFEKKLAQTRDIREQIKTRIKSWIETIQ